MGLKICDLTTTGEIAPQLEKDFSAYIRNPQIYYLDIDKDRKIAYLPYDKVAVLINEKLRKQLEKSLEPKEPINVRLIENRIYIKKEEAKSFFPALPKKPLSYGLTLMLTSKCNARCVYCYASGGEIKDPDLDFEVCKFIIEKLSPKLREICFLGLGEPTLKMDLINKIVTMTRKYNLEYSIVTNGLFFECRNEIVKFLVKNKFYVNLSYDGLPELNNQQRISVRPADSNDEILKTFFEFKEHNYLDRLVINVTVSKLGERKLVEIVDFLAKLGVKKIKFEPVELTGRAKRLAKLSTAATPPDLNIFVENLALAIKRGEEKGVDVVSDWFNINGPRCAHCGAVSLTDFVLKNDLTLHACWEPTPKNSPFYIGKIIKRKGKFRLILNKNKIQALLRRNTYYFEECKNCPVKCGGGCAKQSWDTYKDLCHAGESKRACYLKRKLLKLYLLIKFDYSNIVVK